MQPHQGLEEQAVCERRGIVAEPADSGRARENVPDLGFVLLSHPLEDRRDVARLESGTGVADDRPVE